jgi:hypothetical protein
MRLRRNWRDGEPPPSMLDDLKRQSEHALRARGLPELLGIEGSGAASTSATLRAP